MPVYPGVLNSKIPPTYLPWPSNPVAPVELDIGDTGVAFLAETFSPAQTPLLNPVASIQFFISQGPYVGVMPLVSVEIFFSAAPGVFEIDVQDADTDADAFYKNVGAAITAVNATTFTARVEVQLKCRFIRLYIAALANSVAVTGSITR